MGFSLPPEEILAALAASASPPILVLHLVTFLAHLNGDRALSLATRPVGSRQLALLASGDVEVLLEEVLEVVDAGPAMAGVTLDRLDELRLLLQLPPPTWPEAYVKMDMCLAALQQQRAFRVRRGVMLAPPVAPALGHHHAHSGLGAGSLPGGSESHASAMQGHMTAVTSTTALHDRRAAPSVTMVQPLAATDVVTAEAVAPSAGGLLDEVNRQVAAYGQRAWSFQFGNGKAWGGKLAAAGLPTRIVASNTGLALHTRSLIVGMVGEGFDVGPGTLLIDDLASYIHTMEWEVGVVDGPVGSNTLIYPRLDTLIQGLGGNPATERFPTTRGGRAAGSLGLADNMDHLKLAAANFEEILVKLYHHGGRAPLDALGSFGIATLVTTAVAKLGAIRAKDIFGTLLVYLHRAVHTARTELSEAPFIPGFGKSPLDILAVVSLISSQALAAATARQQSDESVDDRLKQLGFSTAAVQQVAAEAAKKAAASASVAAVNAAVQAAAKATKWGPPGSVAPLAGVDPATLQAGAVDWVAPVRAFEAAQLTDPTIDKACPWWCLYADCKQSRENKCRRCKDGVLCPQKLVDDIKAASKGAVVGKIVGVPATPNPAPGDGAASKRKGHP